MKKVKTNTIVIISMLSAFALLLMTIEIPIIPAFPFYKLDFSDVPVLFGMFVLGPLPGIAIALIRTLLNFIIGGASIDRLVGGVASFISTMSFVLPIYHILKKEWVLKKVILAFVVGTLSLTLIMSLVNYFILLPIYLNVLGLKLGVPISKIVLFGALPFNLIKGTVVCGVFYMVFTKLYPWIKKLS